MSDPTGRQAKVLEKAELVQQLTTRSFLFREMEPQWLGDRLQPAELMQEKLYSSRPIFTAFQPDIFLDYLYIILSGGPVVVRSTPLDRIIGITYVGSTFGMRNLALGPAPVTRAFPSLVEAYKTTDVIKLPVEIVRELYAESEIFRDRYCFLFELREKFQYHLLNCSTYPPQAVAALLRALVYQERALENQPDSNGHFSFDLPVDIIAHACQLNHRTVEQVLKGMTREGILKTNRATDAQGDWVTVTNAEALKGIYSTTRDKVAWWPLR
ncbi:Crp/Fnr family transcriptional regulator [Oscillatoria sp. CS-180]|uniref:Crp/Fnr family transcriptional regulator n=1 Tax=Oscillatoria sp. CS-180 TaxID=3021720 RepID=UPI00232B755B|nr:Crp/Fnr family transcriptional regulator [Oscillatoria sp. CS-180]MDB9527956.1 Crp/Fnr family transcriptional regulator [Oscillatoria sp. CS-180]